ncbi:hypothetical protein CsSME_00022028 [Camellia sinensis var. sinensis]
MAFGGRLVGSGRLKEISTTKIHSTSLYYDTIKELILGHNGLASYREPAGIPELQVQSPTDFH